MPVFNAYPVTTTVSVDDTVLIFQDSSQTVKQISFSDFIASITAVTNNAVTVTPVNSDTTITPQMGILEVNSGASVTITLPLAASSSGITFPIVSKGTGTTTVQASGSDTIKGLTSITVAQYDIVRLTSDGSNLYSF